MSFYDGLVTAFYLGLAVFAVVGTRGVPHKNTLGVLLLFCWAVSNVIFWTLTIDWRPVLFPLLDVLFGLTVASVALSTRTRMVPALLIALSCLAALMNIAFASYDPPTYDQIHAYETVLNALFTLQCLITGFWGLADEHPWADRFHRRRHAAGVSAEPSGHSARKVG